jgi:RNA polymerase sigma-70 factor (ECF subfamily)
METSWLHNQLKRRGIRKSDIRRRKLIWEECSWDYTFATTHGGSMAEKPLQEGVPHQLAPLAPDIAAKMSSSLYGELHRLAVAKMRFERGNHTLQPTALVHEAYLRLADRSEPLGNDRIQVLSLAAQIMRNILVDHARRRQAAKRGAGALQVTFDEVPVAAPASMVDVLAVDDALTRLAKFDPRQAEILELHFFGGLTLEEIALQLGLSARTVKRDWSMARAWLRQDLSATP